ncbi:hypothetical protein GW17_00030932 [Ensete ventricosum]|nr:hypothetical protein GW17_00030932 [Ensete ventricosum]
MEGVRLQSMRELTAVFRAFAVSWSLSHGICAHLVLFLASITTTTTTTTTTNCCSAAMMEHHQLPPTPRFGVPPPSSSPVTQHQRCGKTQKIASLAWSGTKHGALSSVRTWTNHKPQAGRQPTVRLSHGKHHGDCVVYSSVSLCCFCAGGCG